MSLEVYLPLQFSGRVSVGQVLALLEIFVEFSYEAIWTWAFVCWKISDYSFHSLTLCNILDDGESLSVGSCMFLIFMQHDKTTGTRKEDLPSFPVMRIGHQPPCNLSPAVQLLCSVHLTFGHSAPTWSSLSLKSKVSVVNNSSVVCVPDCHRCMLANRNTV